jgi:hypothetical protein
MTDALADLLIRERKGYPGNIPINPLVRGYYA